MSHRTAGPVVCFVADARNSLVHNWLADAVGRGYQVHLATIDGPSLKTEGVLEHRLLSSRAGRLPRSVRYALALPALHRTLRAVGPDLVHAHYAWGYGLSAAILSRKAPLLVSVWGSDVLVQPRRTRAHAAVMRWVLGRASTVGVTSRHLAEETARYTRRPVAVTPFGVDVEQFTPRQEPPTDPVAIGMVKRLDENSGVGQLLEAYADVARRSPVPTRLVLAGERTDDRWARLASELGVGGSTTFLGHVPYAEVPAVLRGMDVFVQPSLRTEGFGVAVLEAQACGVPVVASDLGGLPEVVEDGVTGVLTPTGDVRALGEALLALVTDTDRRRRMGEAARAFVIDRYSQQACGAVMDEVYRTTLGLPDGARSTRRD